MPGTETRLTHDAITAHRPRDADVFARREPSRPAPMPAGAVLVPGTGPGMPVTLPAADNLAGQVTRVAAITRQRKTPPRRHLSHAARAAVRAAGHHRATAPARQPPAAGPQPRHQLRGPAQPPTLILHGRRDKSMPLELAERMQAGIPGSQVEMFRGGHMFFLFTERQQFLDQAGRFLAG